MLPASRRLFLSWLVLLVSALAVGAGAIVLLQREQARLDAQRASTTEARRAAVGARAALVVESTELLAGDIQSGLLETLAGLSDDDAALARWAGNHPFVRAAFRCAADGRILFPAADADGEARAFRRRFAIAVQTGVPWSMEGGQKSAAASLPAPAARSAYDGKEERQAREQAFSNVAQVQNARRDAKVAAKKQDYFPPSSAPAMADARQNAASLAEDSAARDNYRQESARFAEKDTAPARQGWLPAMVENRLHLFGWSQARAGGEVRGVELEVAALIARLGGALPAEVSADEGYALRDEQGRVMHQVGRVANGAAAVARVPLAAGLLPGWEVAAYLQPLAAGSGDGAGFFAIGALLAGILVVAILAGGSLLWWQARHSEAEAACKTSFVANVSHEFKTPLTTIRLYAELLEQGRVAGEERRADYLRTIGREAGRLARLVGNALDFSRLEQGRKKYAREPLDLTAATTRLLDTQEPRLAEAGLALRRELPAGPLEITTDRDALEQILLNLLDNAAKYAADGREVAVELAARPGGGAALRVLDRGPGVPAEHRERIFEKFHRVDDNLTAGQTGTGLGLSIARQLARGLGGGLVCRPREGGGAVFELTLP